MKKLILIDHELYTKRRKQIFMIDDFIKSGYNVEIWDISNIVYPNIQYPDEINDMIVHKLYNIDDLQKKLSSCAIKDTIFIVECLLTWNNRKIYKLLSDFNCYIVKLDLYANTVLEESLLNKISRFISKSFFTIINNKLKQLLFIIYKNKYKIKSFDMVFSSSSIVYRTDKINHPDYESYKKSIEEPALIKDDYIVFCDIFFPEHPDLIFSYKKRPSTAKYRKSLNVFFDFLEKKYNMPVVIAAHPKADYKGDEFENRKIIKYKTSNLVLNSKIVLQHFSNSVSYCILSNKPILFFITEDMNKLQESIQYMKLLAKTLDKKIYNIDKDNLQLIKIEKIDPNIRRKYIYTYLTSLETKDKTNFDILNCIFHKI